MDDEDIVVVDFFANAFSSLAEIEEEIERISQLPDSDAKDTALTSLEELRRQAT